MNRLAVLAAGLVLSAPTLLAQHGGHGGGHHGTQGAGSGSTTDASLTDFNHALAVQATPEQATRFQELTRHTDRARELARELMQLSGKAGSETTLSQRATALKGAVEDAQGGNQDFMKGLTKSQKSGLKELSKKLEKMDSEIGKQWKVLEKELAEADGAGTAAAAERLEKALEEFQSQQASLGNEMGIQTPTT